MIRSMSVLVGLCAAIGCSSGTAEPIPEATPPETVVKGPSVETFAGVWRSVTPSLEFVRLAVNSKSSEMGVLAARLTYSGVAWDGSGRIEGDSLVASMAIIHSTTPTGKMVAYMRDARTLRVQMRLESGGATDLTFVRED